MDDSQMLINEVQALNDDKNYEEVISLLPATTLEKYASADLYSEKALAYYKLDDIDQCGVMADLALSIDNRHPKANNYKGNVYSFYKKYDQAISSYLTAIDSDPTYASTYNNMGNVYTRLRDFDQAANFYKRAISVDPKLTNAYNGLGGVFCKLNQYEEGVKLFHKAIKLDPTNQTFYNNLANAYATQNQYVKAINFYKKSLTVNPKSAKTYFGLGRVYQTSGNFDEAIKAYTKAIEIDSLKPEVYNNLGRVYMALGDNNKAISTLQDGINIEPTLALPHFNLAKVYESLQEYKKAIKEYETYIQHEGDVTTYNYSIAQARIKELKKLGTNDEYRAVKDIVAKIKNLLLFKDGCVTHYTSLSVTKKLIIEGSSLRLSEGTYLNDTSEGREIFKYLKFTVSKNKNDTIAELFTQKPFIGSFVAQTKHDDLALWRMYGKENQEEAKGCALTFDKEKLLENLKDKLNKTEDTSSSIKEGNEFNYYKVAYKKQDDDQFIIPDGSLEEVKELNELMVQLAARVKAYQSKRTRRKDEAQNLIKAINEVAYLFKTSEYQYEYELRLVVDGIGFEKMVDVSLIPPKVYIDLIPVSSLLRKITLGPKVDKADEWASAFYYTLDKNGFSPEIFISHLPFK